MMVACPGLKMEAVFGCVPQHTVENVKDCARLVDAQKAEAVVRTTGFATRCIVPPGMGLEDLMLGAAEAALAGVAPESVGAVVSVSFSAARRFPAQAVRLAHALGLPRDVAAFDISMACSGYPYGLMVAAQQAAATSRRVLLLDGDVQSAFVDPADVNTRAVMGDAASATLVSVSPDVRDAVFSFFTDGARADALTCAAQGPVRMDGFGVFRFVAADVAAFLKQFLETAKEKPAFFAPHAANMYMIRQLAAALGLEDALVSAGARFANTGSSSVALALADTPVSGRTLLAGFGAGLSAAAALVDIPANMRRGIRFL